MNAYMKALGATVGPWVTFRVSNIQTVPDMLHLGEGTHVGDMANMVASLALDAASTLVAPIEIGKQVRAYIGVIPLQL
jgi:fatty acid synthase